MNIFDSILQNSTQSTLSVGSFLLCVPFSIISGLILFLAYSFKTNSTRTFKSSLILLPAIVCVVILMVNGNLGIGVAVAGAFSLVRFRSAPGNAKEICALFGAMCTGLIAGVGYLAYALLFSILISIILIILNFIIYKLNNKSNEKTLKITIPEDLEYNDVFLDLFTDYSKQYELLSVKTTNMGSLFKLTYNITFKDNAFQKEFIDKIRMRNGNLEVAILKKETNTNEL